jgi:hypothetical protein
MGNQLNDFLDVVTPYVKDYAKDLQGARDLGTAETGYNKYKTGLMDSYAKLMAQNQQLLTPNTPEGDQQQGQTSIAQNNQQEQIDPIKEYEKLVNFQSSMNGNPYGEQVSKQAGDMYNMLLGKKEPVKRDIREGNDGLWYDLTSGKPEPIGGVKKPEKIKKRTAGDYSAMTITDVNNLEPNEIENAFYYFTPEVQAELKKNPYFQQRDDDTFNNGDFALKQTGRKSPGGRFNPRSLDEGSDVTAFKNVAQTVEKIDGKQETTDEQNQKYNQNIYDLSKKYNLPVKVIQKVADKINNANGPKEVTKILRSLQNDDFYSDVGTSQEQMNWDANYLNQWEQYLGDVYQNDPANYDAEKKKFWKDLDDIFARGSLTKSEYNNYKKKYF